MKVLIGGAWPYANGSLHIGHISGLLAGDVIARYHRLIGNDVCYVSGSDCHGTPISIRAKAENKTPDEISEKFHLEFIRAFSYLNFSYEDYGKTSSSCHKQFVKEFHENLYKSEYIYEKEELQAYCITCKKFLPDRLLIGKCPNCGNDSRGDQCGTCGFLVEPAELLEPLCSHCKTLPEFRLTKNLFLAISKLEEEIRALLSNRGSWRTNAVSFTNRYINEGLRDRAITRDIDLGIDVPKQGYEDKKIYIWAENVLGYLSSCHTYCRENNIRFESFWNNSEAKHYYVHGKDNIPFHTIILPALLIASEEKYNLPNNIISNEYLTLEGRKISTSGNWAIWVKDLIEKYNSDAIRYYLLSSSPERRDSDFSWKEFLYCNNSELLGAYGNFVNRTLVFIQKSFNGTISDGKIDAKIDLQIHELFNIIGGEITKGKIKSAIRKVFLFIRSANKYFDEEKPWVTAKNDIDKCAGTLYNCVFIIANLAVLLEPFLPESSEKVIQWLSLDRTWEVQDVEVGYNLPEIEILFQRLDKKTVGEEVLTLNNRDEQ